MRKDRLCALFLLAFALLTLPGCWGSKETDETAFVLAMGFDKGEKDDLVATVSIANPKVISGMSGGGGAGGGGGGGGKSTLILSVETQAPVGALNLLNSSIERKISLLHTKAYVFSEEMAREGLGKWLNPLIRYRDLRATSQIYICRGKARDFMEKNNPMLELSPTKQYELLNMVSQEHGLSLNTQLWTFYGASKSYSIQAGVPLVALHEGGLESAKPGMSKGGDIALGKYIAGEVPIAGGNSAQVIGLAVFRGDKMVEVLNGQETRYYLMLRGLFKNGIIGVVDPLSTTQSVGLMVHQARSPGYRTHIDQDGNVTIDVDIFLEPEITGIFSGENYENPDKKPILEEAFSKYIEQGCNALIRRSQEEFKSDVFGFGYQVKHHFWTLQPWQEFNWPQRYPEAQVNVVVHSKIRRTGLQLETAPTVGGEKE